MRIDLDKYLGWIILACLILAIVGVLIWVYYDEIEHTVRGCVSVRTGEHLAGWPLMWYDDYIWVCPR